MDSGKPHKLSMHVAKQRQIARLISVALHIHALCGSRVLVRRGRVVLAELRLGVGHGALEQLALGRDGVLVLTRPCLQRGVLQGPRIREGDVPRVGALV